MLLATDGHSIFSIGVDVVLPKYHIVKMLKVRVTRSVYHNPSKCTD